MISANPDPSDRAGSRNTQNRTASSTMNISRRLRPELRPILSAIDPVLTGFSLFLFPLLIFVSYNIPYSADCLDEADTINLIDLAAQISDIYIDHVGLSHIVIAPDLSQKAVS